MAAPRKRPIRWVLYVIECGDRTLYTGITTDLARRLEQHNNGTASRCTRGRLPVRLVHQEPCRDRSHALRKERGLKMLTRSAKVNYLRQAAKTGRTGKGPWRPRKNG